MKRPALIFADSMSDWWSPGVRQEWRDYAIIAMSGSLQHRFVVLTKRPECITDDDVERWPSNAWLGVSITSGADWWRWDALVTLPERIHKFISAEPLLGGGIAVRIREALKYGAPVPGWLILGPQSGPDAVKPVDTWQRLLRDECDWGAIPLFEKANLPLQPAIRQMPADLESVFRKGLL